MPLHGKREKTMAKYLDPKADLTFKKVFGEHKNLVISLLNALLPLDDGKKVESIEYMTPGFVPRTPLTDYTLLDVLCEEDNPQVNQALGIIEEIEYDDAEVAAYDGFWDRVSRENTFIADAVRSKEQVDAANARGDTDKARADAATEKLRQSARKMKSKGFSVDDIVEFTGLVVDEIKAL